MKSLVLMRHSYASSNNPAFSDRERPLTDEGRAIAQTTAELLTGWNIDRIVCSSAVRTVETAEIIAAATNTPVHALDALYLAVSTAYRDVPVSLADDNENVILVVGHNPGIASLIMSWTKHPLPVAPCTVARFTLPAKNWIDIRNSPPELTDYISDGQRQTLP